MLTACVIFFNVAANTLHAVVSWMKEDCRILIGFGV